jgi:hypothetical protein
MATVYGDASQNNTLPAIGTQMTGALYAFTATGGFEMERQFADITRAEDASFIEYDMTDTVQILYDVRKFNEAIGINKDKDNELVLSATDDNRTVTTNEGDVIQVPFALTGNNDQIDIDANTFRNQLISQKNATGNPVVSIGVYAGMYTQFETYVRTYFGYFGGFASLFNNSSNFDISTNFDVSGMYDLMTASGETDVNGAIIRDISGSIQITNITELLRYAVDTNLFNNRGPSGETYNDSDASFGVSTGNFGIRDGFIADDLIFIRAGTQITLKLDIAQEAYLPINNLNSGATNTHLGSLGSTQTTNFVQTTGSADLAGDFTLSTTASLNNITRVLKAPLLLRLANLSGLNGAAFGSE